MDRSPPFPFALFPGFSISLSLFTMLAKGGVTVQAISDSETLVDS